MTGRASWAIGTTLVGVLVLTLAPAASLAGFQSPPSPPLPCSHPPHEAALSFFEFVEQPGGEDALRRAAREVLARSLQPALDEVLATIRRAKEQYSSSPRDPPLSARLTDAPRLLSRDEPGFDPLAEVTVRFLAATGRGIVEQRAALSCERGAWRVVSFAYGPPPRR